MGGLKFDGVDFNKDWAASIDEAAFIESMIDVVAYPWRKNTPIEREDRLKEAYKLIQDADSSGTTTQTSTGGDSEPSANNRGRDNSKSKDHSGQDSLSANQSGGGQSESTTSPVQKPSLRDKKEK